MINKVRKRKIAKDICSFFNVTKVSADTQDQMTGIQIRSDHGDISAHILKEKKWKTKSDGNAGHNHTHRGQRSMFEICLERKQLGS